MLSACSNARHIQVDAVPIKLDRPPCSLSLPEIDPVRTFPVEWEVVETADGARFAVTPKGYENLAKTQADVLRWVKEARKQLDVYRGAKTHVR